MSRFGRGKLLLGMIAAALAWPVPGAGTSPVFDAATVKRSPPPAGDLIDINLGTIRHGKIIMTNVTLRDCLKFAYGVASDAQITGPDWIGSRDVLFDIVAQAPPETERSQLLPMLQALLADRLAVISHHERRDLPFLALLAGKRGIKIHPAPGSGGNSAWRGHIAGSHMSMPGLAMLLSRFEGRTVIDRTGLQGEFKVNLDWTPDDNQPTPPGSATPPNDQAGPSIYTAVREQLGLRLESGKGPLDVIVVDHASMIPAEN